VIDRPTRRSPAPFVLVIVVLMTPFAAAYVDGPPPGRTGGFGEPTCVECHTGADPDASRGELVIEGLPERFEPGTRYVVGVRLVQEGMRAAGFQMAARFTEGPLRGASAGRLVPVDERVEVVVDSTGVAYAQHTEEGTRGIEGSTAVWKVAWTAPCGVGGPVALHVEANAADDDVSRLGDRIVLAEARSRPAR